MSLDVLLEPVQSHEPKPCKVGQIIANLEEPYRSALQGLLNTRRRDGGLTDQKLRERMLQAGLNASLTSLYHHRSGVCRCQEGKAE